MMPVLVDSSVFIDFFRGKNPAHFKELIESNRVLLSSFVKLELLMGVKKEQYRILNRVLDGLILLPTNFDWLFEKSRELIHKLKSSGVNLGLVDIFIALEAAHNKSRLYTLDKGFKKLEELNYIELFKH